MPYIDQTSRQVELDGLIEALVSQINNHEPDARHGMVNYAMTKLVLNCLKPEDGWRYHALQKAYGVFHCAAAEFYRRLIAPYEDNAIMKNGDLYEYLDP
jgi:hypothetical protein